MNVAYFDCIGGASGDMLLSALLGSGLPIAEVEKSLKNLNLSCRLQLKQVTRQGLGATQLKLTPLEKKVVRTFSNIQEIIEQSRLPKSIKEKTLAILKLLAEVESRIHRVKLEQVHFHEIGALDTLVDIVGFLTGLNYFKLDELYASALPTGVGFSRTDHGLLPLPSPATLEILKGVPIYSLSVQAELTTPTGAAILKTMVKKFGEMPPMIVKKIGYGAGEREHDFPNVVRVLLGKSQLKAGEEAILIETNIDDINPQILGYLCQELFQKGALDVWLTPIQMKKGRPGTLLSLLVKVGDEESFLDYLFSETSTLGARLLKLNRRKMEREIITVKTSIGQGKVKIGRWKGKILTFSPEYEDCVRIAKERNLPLEKVQERLKTAALSKLKKKISPKKT